MPPRPRVDDRRVSRGSPPIAPSGRNNPGGNRIRARLADRFDKSDASRAECARAIGVALRAEGCASTRRGERIGGRSRARFWRLIKMRRHERATRSFAVRGPHRGRIAFIFLLARLGRRRRGADCGRADPKPWAWYGHQRSAPSRGSAAGRLNDGQRQTLHEFDAALGNS